MSSRVRVWILSLSLSCLLFSGDVRAETAFSDSFDDYNPGDLLGQQPGWGTWDQVGVDCPVTDELAASEPNSVRIESGTDVVALPIITGGRWTVRAKVYIPVEMTGDGYFILLNTYSHGGPKNWSTQIKFSQAGVEALGGSEVAAVAEVLPMIFDEWIELRIEVDLDGNTQEFYYDDQLFGRSAWQSSGSNTLQAIDLFSDGSTEFFIDDVIISSACELSVSAEPASGSAPLDVKFSVTVDTCDAELTTFAWDFGDGNSGEGNNPSHRYEEAGIYVATVQAEDEAGISYTATTEVVVRCLGDDVSPWILDSVGEPSWLGCARSADDCLEFEAGGAGADSTRDELNFLYQELSGDFSVSTKPVPIEWGTDWDIGLMARSSLVPGSAFAFAALTQTEEGTFPSFIRRRRTSTAIVARPDDLPVEAGETYLRLDRFADDFTVFTSVNGTDWTEIRTLEVPGAPATMLVGLVVSPAGDPTSVGSAQFCETKVEVIAGGQAFQRGDANASGARELSDAIYILNNLFLGGADFECREAADYDDNGQINLSDGIAVLNFLFLAGAGPVEPVECGVDPEGSVDISCESYGSCP
ncbi:MAG: PKD domain-containing protein [Planctomycetota bacterium]